MLSGAALRGMPRQAGSCTLLAKAALRRKAGNRGWSAVAVDANAFGAFHTDCFSELELEAFKP